MPTRPKAKPKAEPARAKKKEAARTEWNSYLRFRENTPVRIEKIAGKNTAEAVKNIKKVLEKAIKDDLRVKVVGAGHSFSDLLHAPDVQVDCEGINFLETLVAGERKRRFRGDAVDNDNLFEVGSGITVEDLHNKLWKEGKGLINMGSFNLQKLMGVVATSTHGSGIDLPPFPDMVKSLVLVTQDEKGVRAFRIEPKNGITDPTKFKAGEIDELIQDDDVFFSVLVNMGCMGIVASVILKTMDAYFIHEKNEITTWAEFKQDFLVRGNNGKLKFDKELRDNRTVELVVAPHKDTASGLNFKFQNQVACLIRRRTLTNDKKKSGHKMDWFGSLAKCIQEATSNYDKTYDMPFDGPTPATAKFAPENFPMLLKTFVTNEGYTDKYFEVFLQGGASLGGYAIEIAAPVDRLGPIMDKIIELAEENKKRDMVHTGPVGVRFVKGSNAYLSPQYGRDTVMFEVTMIRGTKNGDKALKRVEQELYKMNDVRIHWGLQMSSIQNMNLAEKYPNYTKWLFVYRRFNRAGLFNNALTDRLNISVAR